MISLIQTRLKILFCLALCASLSLGYVSYSGWNKYTSMHESLNLTYSIEETVTSLKVNKYDKHLYKELKSTRALLEPKHRADALSDVIQAYADKSPWLLKKRVKHFLKNELEYRRYARNMMAYWQNRVIYFAALAAGSLLTVFLLMVLYIRYSIFNPLKDLARKMTDFLNNKYSYQFSVPDPNEVGQLHATFNALAQQVLSNMDELTTLDRAKSEFLNIASHELRTPLTSIKGSLSLLQSGVAGDVNDSSKNLMNIAETETDRLIRLINDVLDLAKIEAGRLPLEKEWVSLESLVNETITSLQGLATTASVRLEASKLPHLEIDVDSDRIKQVLTNLISNAIKFSPEKGVVNISADIDAHGSLRLNVHDQGRGIAPEDIERIFEKFSQATGPNNPLVKGTGLGLAIARAIVTEHEGHIGVESTIGKGSQFYFTLAHWRIPGQNANSGNIKTTQGAVA